MTRSSFTTPDVLSPGGRERLGTRLGREVVAHTCMGQEQVGWDENKVAWDEK